MTEEVFVAVEIDGSRWVQEEDYLKTCICAQAAEAENARLRQALKPFADKWESLRDPLPQGPFSVTVLGMDCCLAYRALLHEGEK
jgi:hypothetical protein